MDLLAIFIAQLSLPVPGISSSVNVLVLVPASTIPKSIVPVSVPLSSMNISVALPAETALNSNV